MNWEYLGSMCSSFVVRLLHDFAFRMVDIVCCTHCLRCWLVYTNQHIHRTMCLSRLSADVEMWTNHIFFSIQWQSVTLKQFSILEKKDIEMDAYRVKYYVCCRQDSLFCCCSVLWKCIDVMKLTSIRFHLRNAHRVWCYVTAHDFCVCFGWQNGGTASL